MIKIIVDSSSDYSIQELKQKNLLVVPMNITFDENIYQDGINLTTDEFYYKLIDNTIFPKTAQPSPQVFVEIFEEAKSCGDEVICLLLSSGLSGTFQSASLAKCIVDYDKIYLIDTLLATAASKVLADYACELRNKNFSACDIVEKLEVIKKRVKVTVAVDTLEYLYRGGRLTKTTATIGEYAKIKPVITLNKEGKIEVLGKCIGKVKAMNFMLNYMKHLKIDPQFPIYLLYTFGLENCEKFQKKIESNGEQVKGLVQIGATIGAHLGPGAFGIVFVEKTSK